MQPAAPTPPDPSQATEPPSRLQQWGRRVLIWITVLIAVRLAYAGYQYLTKKPKPQASTPNQTQQVTANLERQLAFEKACSGERSRVAANAGDRIQLIVGSGEQITARECAESTCTVVRTLPPGTHAFTLEGYRADNAGSCWLSLSETGKPAQKQEAPTLYVLSRTAQKI